MSLHYNAEFERKDILFFIFLVFFYFFFSFSCIKFDVEPRAFSYILMVAASTDNERSISGIAVRFSKDLFRLRT